VGGITFEYEGVREDYDKAVVQIRFGSDLKLFTYQDPNLK